MKLFQSRPDDLPAIKQDMERRLEAWKIMSELFLDTDVTDDYHYLARTLAELNYNEEQLDFIFWQELYPVLRYNLIDVVGVWAGFEQESYVPWILTRSRRKRKIWYLYKNNGPIGKYLFEPWNTIKILIAIRKIRQKRTTEIFLTDEEYEFLTGKTHIYIYKNYIYSNKLKNTKEIKTETGRIIALTESMISDYHFSFIKQFSYIQLRNKPEDILEKQLLAQLIPKFTLPIPLGVVTTTCKKEGLPTPGNFVLYGFALIVALSFGVIAIINSIFDL